MPYTNAVPQANQTIASTTNPIRNNFVFIQTDLQEEHVFNGNGVPTQAEGTHIKASMANIADPASLPTATNGTYYVSGGQPKFYNGTVNFLSMNQFILKGTVALTGSYSTVVALPVGSCGNYWIHRVASNSPSVYAIGSFVVGQTTGIIYAPIDPGIDPQFTGLNLQARTSTNATYNYTVVYYLP